ncbi:MAG: MGMT family protein [Oscillospiraceae bacterium]|nr:MGMT family protein [Oscillospiraceae bacterium]
MTDEKLIYEVLAVVGEIPEGKAATYGQIARLIGREKQSRLVGKILSLSDQYGEYPCHRVVNHAGRIVPGWTEQTDLLLKEGVPFRKDGYVDLRQCQWVP